MPTTKPPHKPFTPVHTHPPCLAASSTPAVLPSSPPAQSELDGEIQRLHRQLAERSAEAMRHGQEAAAAAAAVQQANARAQVGLARGGG